MASRRGFYRLISLILFLGAVAVAFGQETKFPQRLEWLPEEDALLYKVEVQPLDGGESMFQETDDVFADLSLPPGVYRYRVYAYDLLGREASVTSWNRFEIIKMGAPEIARTEETPVFSKESDAYEIAVDVADVTDETVVELVNEETNEVVRGSLVLRAVKAQFTDVPEGGAWKLRITNPGGLSAETDTAIAVTSADEAKKQQRTDERAAEKAAKAAAAEKERAQREAARQQAEEERRAAEEARRAKAEAERIAAEEEKARKAAEKEAAREAKKAWRAEHPYISKNINLLAGAGLFASPYDGTLMDYSDRSVLPALTVRLSYFPVVRGVHRFGLELAGMASRLSHTNDYMEINLTALRITASAVYQHRIFSDKCFVSAKAGGGVFSLRKAVDYLQAAEGIAPPAATWLSHPAVQVGASVFVIPASFLVVEAGLDVTHVFAGDMPTGIINPYLCIGLRL